MQYRKITSFSSSRIKRSTPCTRWILWSKFQSLILNSLLGWSMNSMLYREMDFHSIQSFVIINDCMQTFKIMLKKFIFDEIKLSFTIVDRLKPLGFFGWIQCNLSIILQKLPIRISLLLTVSRTKTNYFLCNM